MFYHLFVCLCDCPAHWSAHRLLLLLLLRVGDGQGTHFQAGRIRTKRQSSSAGSWLIHLVITHTHLFIETGQHDSCRSTRWLARGGGLIEGGLSNMSNICSVPLIFMSCEQLFPVNTQSAKSSGTVFTLNLQTRPWNNFIPKPAF